MPRAVPFAAALLLAVVRTAAAFPDCDGGAVGSVKLSTGRVRIDATVTRPGATHDTFVTGPGGLTVELVDSAGASVLYTVNVPSDRFVTHGRTTKYDRTGAFGGRITLKNANRQDDTVRIILRATDPSILPVGDIDVRVFVNTGSRCARTCVGECTPRASGLVCKTGALYVPEAGEGFGAYGGTPPRRTSPYCGLDFDQNDPCDYLIDERCILPYPSSRFLVPDASTPTGLRLAYPPQGLPRNTMGTYIDPTDWNTLDGYSPGPMILALFPDTGFPVDLGLSNVAFHTNFARSLDADHPTVVMKASTGERIVHFAEMDANTNDVTKKALIIRPGRRLEDGTQYYVAIRDLVDTQGNPIRARLPFRALRAMTTGPTSTQQVIDACPSCFDAMIPRVPAFQAMFDTLQANGVDPADLVLAWDFTTASTQALTGWIVSVRDQAFALGTPTFQVTSVADGGGTGLNADIWAEVEGTFQAPLFMTADAPASRLNLVGGVPTQNGYAAVPFVVEIPRAAYDGVTTTPGRPSLWGHGLLGDRYQVRGLNPFANQYDFVMAGVDMQGMSGDDLVPAVVPLIRELSLFHFIPERLHQGFLNHLLLGRLMLDPIDGFNSDPAFRPGGTGVIDTTEVYYSGGSQGGIFGIAIMSIAEDFKRGFLAVPGANYSTLLHRSIDFNPYLTLSRTAYPDRLDEELTIALIQQLWDRAEPQGYENHLVAGDLSSPPVPHDVLIHMSTCDSQVSNLATEIMVRSLGVPSVTPVLRSFFDVDEMAAPYDGSAFVEIDWQKCGSRCNVPGGDNPGAACTTNADCPGPGDPPSRTRCDSGTPPLTNTAPPFENDAHGAEGDAPPTAPTAQQVDAFLRPTGTVQQFCSGACDPN